MQTTLITSAKEVQSRSSSILNTSILEAKAIKALLKGELLALRVYPFIDSALCATWKEKIEASGGFTRYSVAPDVEVQRSGYSFFETRDSDEKTALYYQAAEQTQALMDSIFGDTPDPLRVLHSKVRKAWPAGAQAENIEGQDMVPGAIRIYEANAVHGLPPHQDLLVQDAPESVKAQAMIGQLAANVYLDVAAEGGELELWNYEPTQEQVKEIWISEIGALDKSRIPVEKVVLKPRPLELILFRSTCIHSVRPSKGGIRSTASAFFGYYGDDMPLTYWA